MLCAVSRSVPSFSLFLGFPGGAVAKNLPPNAPGTRDLSLIPGLRRSPAEGNGNPLQYSCLENSMDRGAWQALVCGVAKESDTTERLHYTINNALKLCIWKILQILLLIETEGHCSHVSKVK